MPDWLELSADGCVLRLKVQPGAKRSRVVGPYASQLKVAVAAPPVDGKANAALLSWLSETLGVKRSCLTLMSGETGRDKRVKVVSLDSQQVLRLLSSAYNAS